MSQQEASEQNYYYTYDSYSRMTAGYHNGNNNEQSIGYDSNGNINALTRTGAQAAGLSYTYSGNRLASLTKDGTPYSHAYDSNGNNTTEGLRGMTIAYNYLNLPRTVTKGSDVLTYIYDAAGSKLAEKLNTTVNNFYAGAIVYKGDKTIDYIPASTGLFRKVGNDFVRQYNINDHLGNVRAVVNQSGTIEQTTDYYPYGLAFSYNNLDKNRYLYNGKELQNQTLAATFFGVYYYGARMYDPQLGRWHTSDPLAELDLNFSPYNYCLNNPVNLFDPNGLSTHTDSTGAVVAVYNDGNNSVYKHGQLAENYATYEGETETYRDPETGEMKTREKARLSGGENMGKTENWDEFRAHDEKTGKTLNKVEGKKMFGESWDYAIDLNNRTANKMNLADVAANSIPNRIFDIKKSHTYAPNGSATGKMLNGKYATARSAGNYLAGLNGATGKFMGGYISFGTYMRLAGQVHSPFNFIGSPYYGEIPYAGRMIVSGFNAGVKKRK